jgi:hypothetical protein
VITTSLPDLGLGPNQQRDITIDVTDNDPANTLQWQAEFGTAAYLLDLELGLVNTDNYFTNASRLRQEKWVQDSIGNWYFLLPNGEFRSWDSNSSTATGPLLKLLDPIYYFNPRLLTDANNSGNLAIHQQGLDMAFVLDNQLNFQDPNAPGVGGLWENWGGRNERWIRGTNFQGQTQWFFILPNGELYWSDNQGGANGWLTARLDPMYYEVEMLRQLAESGGLPAPQPAVTVSFTAASTNNYSNTMTIAANGYRGTVWMRAQVSDDTGTGYSRIFQVSFRNLDPNLSNPGTVNVASGGTTQFNLFGSDSNPGDDARLTWDIGFATP